MTRRNRRRRRKGNVLVLTAVMLVAMFALLAFAVDLGYLHVARTQLQRTADAAAIAATWELVDEGSLAYNAATWQAEANARETASEYAALNPVLRHVPSLGQDDVDVGYMADPSDPNSQMISGGASRPNVVKVRVRRTSDQNGEVPLFFARILGIDQAATQAEATAAVLYNVRGFRTPSSGENLGVLPFALDLDTWNGLLAGIGGDNWKWDAELGQVVPGADGILEVNLYPQGTGAPGNRGTVDIGSNNNSTADIARQILHGASPQDLAYLGGKLELNENGKLFLNGDTGISAGVKDELASIIGKPRIVPVFSQVQGPGNNAQYTIVQFVGVRILDVKLTGKMSTKRVTIQPANVVTRGAIPSPETTPTSHYVYSTVWLVR
jgi:hypothetical protein